MTAGSRGCSKAGAAAACAEVQAATPKLALVDYCLGRVAQAEGNGTVAFRHLRDFLDRWAEADAGNMASTTALGMPDGWLQR